MFASEDDGVVGEDGGDLFTRCHTLTLRIPASIDHPRGESVDSAREQAEPVDGTDLSSSR